MSKLNLIMILMLTSIISYASDSFSVLYKVEKDGKKLGHYEVNMGKDEVSSNSYGAANRLEMFSTKKVIFSKDGLKNVEFTRNKKKQMFIVATKVSALDADLKKKYDRKFSKVQNDEMLFITKDTKKRIELFNKRKTVVKTFDELLSDIYYSKVSYNKFILFDKLGVMKMVAELSISGDSVTVTNASKNKPYMKITLSNGIPTKIESLLSSWSATAQTSGVLKEHILDLNQVVSKSYVKDLKKELSSATVTFTKAKKSRKSYEFSGELAYILPSDITTEKSYKQKEYCKKLFKKSKVKFKKIAIANGSCTANIKAKMSIKELKESVLEMLIKEHEELKITKKVKFNKDSITYEVF